MANNFTPVGTEVQVNALTNNIQRDADIAVLSDGRFAVVYEHQSLATEFDIYLRFINPDGTESGGTVYVERDQGNQFNPVVTAFGTGVLVIWQDDAATAEIHYATVSSSLRLGTERALNTSNFDLSRPDAASLDDGRVIVVSSRDTQGGDLVFGFINATATGATGTGLLAGGASEQDSAAVAASGNNALVVFRHAVGAEVAIGARFYDGIGSAATDFLAETGVSTGGIPVNPDVAALTDGRYIVVWTNLVNSDVEGRFVSAAGDPVGDVFTISSAPGSNNLPRVAALPDGGFIVTFNDNGGLFSNDDAVDGAIVARRFDGSGNPAGDLFLVNAGDVAEQLNPAIAVNAGTGRALIAWDDFRAHTEDNSPPGVRGRAFQVTTDIVNGTDKGDSITTYGLAEEINGLKGKDQIRAGDGDDIINGGKQSDELFGEGGVDTFVFDNRKGKDTLDWEDGEQLHFDSSVFGKPKKLGVLKKKHFEKGDEADDGNDYFVFLKAKGKLWYDGNGDKTGKMKLIARLDKGSDLDASEIFLV